MGDISKTPAVAGRGVGNVAGRLRGGSEVNVTCQGPFRFDFQKSVATLEDRVDIVHNNLDGPGDQLNCDRLQIYFRTSAEKAAAASSDPPAATNAGSHPRPPRATRWENCRLNGLKPGGFP